MIERFAAWVCLGAWCEIFMCFLVILLLKVGFWMLVNSANLQATTGKVDESQQ